MYRDNGVSFDFWPRKDVQIGKVAFKACNDPMVYTILRDYSGLLLVVSRRFRMHVFFRLEGSGILARFSSTQRFDRRPRASVSLRCILFMESQHYPVLPFSALTIGCIFPDLTRIPHLNTHPTENSLHVGDFYVRVRD